MKRLLGILFVLLLASPSRAILLLDGNVPPGCSVAAGVLTCTGFAGSGASLTGIDGNDTEINRLIDAAVGGGTLNFSGTTGTFSSSVTATEFNVTRTTDPQQVQLYEGTGDGNESVIITTAAMAGNATITFTKTLAFTGTFTDGKLCQYASSGNVISCTADTNGTGDFMKDGSVPMEGALVPNAANTLALGSATAEWADLFLGDGAIIYGQNDQSNTLTSSATAWTAALDLSVQGGDVTIADAGVKLTGSNGSLTILGLGDGQDEDVKIDLNTTANTIEITSPASSATTVDFNALNLVTTGKINGALDVVGDSDNHTLTATELYGGFVEMTGAGTVIINDNATTGMSFCVFSTGANAVLVRSYKPSDSIILKAGTDLGSGVAAKVTKAGQVGCFIASSVADKWRQVSGDTWATE